MFPEPVAPARYIINTAYQPWANAATTAKQTRRMKCLRRKIKKMSRNQLKMPLMFGSQAKNLKVESISFRIFLKNY